MNNSFLKEFLHFGYLPAHVNEYPFDIEKVVITPLQGDEQELKNKAYLCFKKVIVKQLTSKKVLIPLSGGIDSRIILAEVMNHLNPEQIRTVTFGVPGNLDAELPSRISDEFGLNHHFIDLRKINISEEILIQHALDSQYQTNLLEAYWSHSMFEIIEKEETVISGFIGDRITGSVSENLQNIQDFDSAKEFFLSENRIDKSGYLPVLSPDRFEVDNDSYEFLAPYEKLDYRIRQMNMTVSIVLGGLHNIKIPLTDPEFVSFFYSIDPKYRHNQSLFFEMAADYYPDFFKIGVKNFYGAAIQSSSLWKNINRKYYYGKRILNRRYPSLHIQDPIHNYVDPYWFFVKNKPTAELTAKTMSDLSKRSLFTDVNPTFVLEKFQKGEMKFKNALEVLFNLELYLKAGVFE